MSLTQFGARPIEGLRPGERVEAARLGEAGSFRASSAPSATTM
jgi:hypothetical protein